MANSYMKINVILSISLALLPLVLRVHALNWFYMHFSVWAITLECKLIERWLNWSKFTCPLAGNSNYLIYWCVLKSKLKVCFIYVSKTVIRFSPTSFILHVGCPDAVKCDGPSIDSWSIICSSQFCACMTSAWEENLINVEFIAISMLWPSCLQSVLQLAIFSYTFYRTKEYHVILYHTGTIWRAIWRDFWKFVLFSWVLLILEGKVWHISWNIINLFF